MVRLVCKCSRRIARLIAVALTVMMLGGTLGGCPGGWRSGLPPDPPPLEVVCSERKAAGRLSAWCWTAPGGRRVVADEVWPPLLPAKKLVVEPEEDLAFGLLGTTKRPEAVLLELFYAIAFDMGTGPGEPVGRWEFSGEQVGVQNGSLVLGWKVPSGSAPWPGRPEESYAVRVRVAWPAETWALYYVRLQVLAPGTLRAAKAGEGTGPLDVSRAFFSAAWRGDRSGVEKVLSPDALRDMGVVSEEDSFTSVRELSPWELISWRVSGWEFTLEGEPEFRLEDLLPGFARVKATYRVTARNEVSGKVSRYEFREEHEVERRLEGWRVRAFRRWGIPWEAEGGTAPGRAIRVVQEGGLLKCGPFTGLNPSYGLVWDPEGRRVAFRGDNFERMELWVVDARERAGKCLMALPVTQAAHGGWEQDLHVLGWFPDGSRVLFLVAGYQSWGPYRGRQGWWVGWVPVRGGEPVTVAFVPAGRAQILREARLTQDASGIFILRMPDLYRISVVDGRVDHLESDLPSYDGLFRFAFSPDGWGAAWELVESADDRVVVLADLRGGRKAELRRPAGVEWMSFRGWIPDGLLAVVHARSEEIRVGEDSSWPAGCTAVCLYDIEGVERFRVLPPGGPGDRIGAFAWSPDGSRMVFASGPVETGGLQPVHLSRDLRVWDRDTGGCRRLATLSGSACVEWPVPSVVQAWYFGRDGNSTGQGIEVYPDEGGRVVEVSGHPFSTAYVAEREGAVVALEAVPSGQRRVLVRGPGGHVELARGSYSAWGVRSTPEWLALVDDPPSGGEGCHLVVVPWPSRR